ncbi:MAG: hypothetical protein SOV35_03930 [Clostridium sp.]|nr:hypothetical protein [Clostridium sp.]
MNNNMQNKNQNNLNMQNKNQNNLNMQNRNQNNMNMYNMNMQNRNQNNLNTHNNTHNIMNNQRNFNGLENINNTPPNTQHKKNTYTLVIGIIEIFFSIISCLLCLQGNSAGSTICLICILIIVLTYIIFKNIKSKNTILCIPAMAICIVGILISASGISNPNDTIVENKQTTTNNNSKTNTNEVSSNNNDNSQNKSNVKNNNEVVVQEERQVKDIEGAMNDTVIDTTQWNDIERYPDKYMNAHVGFVGTVVYASEDNNNEVKLLIDEQGGSTIKVNYKYGKDQGRILSGDEIVGIGTFQGLSDISNYMQVNADVIGPKDFRSALMIMQNFASKVEGGMEVKYLGKLKDLCGDANADFYTFMCPTEGKYYVYKEKILYLYDIKTKQMTAVYGAC